MALGTRCGSPFPSDGSDTVAPLSLDPHAPCATGRDRMSGPCDR